MILNGQVQIIETYNVMRILILSTFLASAALAQSPGRIVGVIDRITTDDSGSHVRGWACQQGRPESIDVHIYAGDSATKEHVVYSGHSNLDNE